MHFKIFSILLGRKYGVVAFQFGLELLLDCGQILLKLLNILLPVFEILRYGRNRTRNNARVNISLFVNLILEAH